jgi:tripartite-type tricarboxylate transporter receptor subunit TctC
MNRQERLGRRRFLQHASVALPLGSALGLAIAVPGTAFAQTFPSRPVRIVVPFAPGGGNDVFARHLAGRMTDLLKQQVVVENRAGAGGTIGSDIVAKAAPDGYTLLLGHTGTLAINPALYPRLPYDARTAFVAVGPLASAPLVLVVPSASPLTSLAELLTAAKAAPGKLTFASSGSGTGGHLAGKLLEQSAGISLVHVPYRGTAPALNDVLGGQVDMMFSVIPPTMPHADSGRLRALAVTGGSRNERLPTVPTIAEAGISGYESTLAYGLMAPAGTPPQVLQTLATALAAALDSPKLREAFRMEGAEPMTGTAAEFEALIRSDMQKYGELIRAAGITVE